MNADEVLNGVLGEISVISGRDVSGLFPDGSLKENGIDSMGFVELLLAVKRLYGVNLVDAGLRAQDVRSIRALVGKILEKQSEQSARQ